MGKVTPFTVYPTITDKGFEKGSPCIVSETREVNKKLEFLVANQDGVYGWFDASLFREHQRQALQ